MRRIREYFAKRKKQNNCKHEDVTIVASGPEYALLYCYDCEKEWTEKT